MAEIRINATGGLKLYDADDSHYAQILAGTITSNTDVMTLGHAAVVMGAALDINGNELILDADADTSITADTDGQIDFKIEGTDVFNITNSSNDVVITQTVQDKDFVIKGDDGGGAITALTVDMSAAGQFHFKDGTAALPIISNAGDTDTGLLFSAANKMQFSSGGTAQVTFEDGAIVPVTDSDIDLGTSSLEFKDGYFDGTIESDAYTVGGVALANEPTASVYLASDQSINASTQTKLLFATEDYDVGADFASNKYTVGVAGKYLITMLVTLDSLPDTKRIQIRLYKNGSEYTNTYATNGAEEHCSANIVMVVDLDASDYIEGYVFHNGSSALDALAGDRRTLLTVTKMIST